MSTHFYGKYGKISHVTWKIPFLVIALQQTWSTSRGIRHFFHGSSRWLLITKGHITKFPGVPFYICRIKWCLKRLLLVRFNKPPLYIISASEPPLRCVSVPLLFRFLLRSLFDSNRIGEGARLMRYKCLLNGVPLDVTKNKVLLIEYKRNDEYCLRSGWKANELPASRTIMKWGNTEETLQYCEQTGLTKTIP
jgi:hypothetical protein